MRYAFIYFRDSKPCFRDWQNILLDVQNISKKQFINKVSHSLRIK